MNRREAVMTIATAATSVPLMVLAADKPAAPAAKAPAAAPSYAAMIDAAEHCVGIGEECFELALTLLKKGDVSMAECSDTTRAMMDICETTARFARAGSPHTKALAGVCAKVCRDCEKACRKHEQHHAECKNCADSCAKCAAECEKISA
jgi:Cys-rich four helix bundle protein (predicted Tat secretion target)